MELTAFASIDAVVKELPSLNDGSTGRDLNDGRIYLGQTFDREELRVGIVLFRLVLGGVLQGGSGIRITGARRRGFDPLVRHDPCARHLITHFALPRGYYTGINRRSTSFRMPTMINVRRDPREHTTTICNIR